MKKAAQVLSFLVFVSVAVMAGRSYNNVTDPALNSPVVGNYLSQGFVMDSVTPNAHRYIMEPTGTYEWGVVTVQLHGKTGGLNSLETTYATVTFTIEASQKGSNEVYRVLRSEVYENVVY